MSSPSFWHKLNDLVKPAVPEVVTAISAPPKAPLRVIDHTVSAARRCCSAPNISERLRTHVEERRHCRQYHFRGLQSRTWIELDETIFVEELRDFLGCTEIRSFLQDGLVDCSYVCCVAMQLLVASENAKQSSIHTDHTHGYGKLVWLVFDIEGGLVDTLLEERGRLRPADCLTLLFDAYHRHAGPAGASSTKIFVGLANPTLPDYKRIEGQNRTRTGSKRVFPQVL